MQENIQLFKLFHTGKDDNAAETVSCNSLQHLSPLQPQNMEECSALVVQFSSVTQSCPTLWPYELQHARPPCPSPTPGVHSNPCPSSQWCHPAISSSVVPFSSCLQSLPASGSFPMSWFFASGGQSIGVPASASVLPMNIQDWSLGWTGRLSDFTYLLTYLSSI